MRVSVLIATYNSAAYIAETLESVLSQNYDDYEVVVGDDGSTDGTLDILSRYQARHPDRLILVSGPNLGITGNCNRTLARMTGDLIAFCGGDDVFLPGKILAQVQWFRDHPAGVLCGHAVEVFEWPSGRVLSTGHTHPHGLTEGRGPAAFLKVGSFFVGCSIMIRRSAMPAYGFDSRFPIASDGKMWLDVLAAGGVWGTAPGVLARYRKHPGNITRLKADQIREEVFQRYGIFEALHPEHAGSCAIGRGNQHFVRGMDLLWENRRSEARRFFRAALEVAPFTPRFAVGAALSLLPFPLLTAVRASRRRLKHS